METIIVIMGVIVGIGIVIALSLGITGFFVWAILALLHVLGLLTSVSFSWPLTVLIWLIATFIKFLFSHHTNISLDED